MGAKQLYFRGEYLLATPVALRSKRSGNVGSCCKATDNSLPDGLRPSQQKLADFGNKARQQSLSELKVIRVFKKDPSGFDTPLLLTPKGSIQRTPPS